MSKKNKQTKKCGNRRNEDKDSCHQIWICAAETGKAPVVCTVCQCKALKASVAGQKASELPEASKVPDYSVSYFV